MGNTGPRPERRQRGEPRPEAGSAGREAAAARGAQSKTYENAARKRATSAERRDGSPPRPAVDRAYADDEQDDRPEGEADGERVEEGRADAVVGAAAPEDVGTEGCDLEGPDDEERERHRREREREHVAGAAKRAGAPQAPYADVERAADDEVAGEGDEGAGDNGPDCHDQAVVQGVVVERARGARAERDRDPGQRGEQEDGLGARVQILGGLLSHRDEDRARRQENAGHPQPPLAVGIHSRERTQLLGSASWMRR